MSSYLLSFSVGPSDFGKLHTSKGNAQLILCHLHTIFAIQYTAGIVFINISRYFAILYYLSGLSLTKNNTETVFWPLIGESLVGNILRSSSGSSHSKTLLRNTSKRSVDGWVTVLIFGIHPALDVRYSPGARRPIFTRR